MLAVIDGPDSTSVPSRSNKIGSVTKPAVSTVLHSAVLRADPLGKFWAGSDRRAGTRVYACSSTSQATLISGMFVSVFGACWTAGRRSTTDIPRNHIVASVKTGALSILAVQMIK